jgi:hypothetical protein
MVCLYTSSVPPASIRDELGTHDPLVIFEDICSIRLVGGFAVEHSARDASQETAESCQLHTHISFSTLFHPSPRI